MKVTDYNEHQSLMTLSTIRVAADAPRCGLVLRLLSLMLVFAFHQQVSSVCRSYSRYRQLSNRALFVWRVGGR
jgi:hypothetical protein